MAPRQADPAGPLRLRVRARAWIECASRPFLGGGRARLLEAVEAQGSITAAARSLGLSYRTAWLRIEAMNAAFGVPVVETSTGGKGGGGAGLTPFGRAAVRIFRRIAEEQTRLAERLESELAAELAAAVRGQQGRT